jgi:hypothetical protein
VNHHESALNCRFAVSEVAVEGSVGGQLREPATSLLAMAVKVLALHPRREVMDSEADDDQHNAFHDHQQFVHSRSISRAIAAFSK